MYLLYIKKVLIEQSFAEIKSLIDRSRYEALKSVNTEFMNLYWKIGEYITAQTKNAVWDEKTIDQLAEYLKSHGLTIEEALIAVTFTG